MALLSTRTRRLAGSGAVLAGVLASTALGATAVSATSAGANLGGTWSTSALDCGPGELTASSGARVAEGATAKEPKLYPTTRPRPTAP